MAETGVIILAHGSRNGCEAGEILRKISHGVKTNLPPDVEVVWATLQFNYPNLEEAVGSSADQCGGRVRFGKHAGCR